MTSNSTFGKGGAKTPEKVEPKHRKRWSQNTGKGGAKLVGKVVQNSTPPFPKV